MKALHIVLGLLITLLLVAGPAHGASYPSITFVPPAPGGEAGVRIEGMTQEMIDGFENGSYRADFRLLGKDGSRILFPIIGHIEGSAKGGSAVATLTFYDLRPGKGSIPPSTYILEYEVYKLTRGTPSYVLNSTSVLKARSAPFKYPLGSTGTAPTCILSASTLYATLGSTVQLSWVSENTKKLSWVKSASGKNTIKPPKKKPKAQGSASVKMSKAGEHVFTLKAAGKGSTTTCSVTVPVL